MSFLIEYKISSKYLIAKYTGDWIRDNAVNFFNEIKIEADKQEKKRILINLIGVSYPDSEMTRFYSGEKISQAFNSSYKISCYMQTEKTNKYAEMVARNRGARFKVFDCETNAINWLLS